MLEQRIVDHFRKVSSAEPGDTLLVAVSGGPDSVALLHLLLDVRDTLGVSIEVAHLDHGLRGEEGRRDARFVSDLCARKALTIHSRRVDIPAIHEEEGGSREALARRERYAFLDEAQAVAGARWIVTGHTANDQAETFLMNLLRGAGPRGLGGMLAAGPGSVCRPLLETWKEEVMEYLESHNLDYCVDKTNQDLSLTRNRIRHRLVPLLEQEFGPSVLRTLTRESQLMNDLDDFLSMEADRILRLLTIEEDPRADEIRFDVGALMDYPLVLKRSVLRAALEDLAGGLESFTLGHIDSLVDLVHRPEGTAQVDLPRGLRGRREYGYLVLEVSPDDREAPTVPEASEPLDLEHPGELRWGRVHLKWSPARAEELENESLAGSPDRGFFDLEVAVPPVYLRSVRPGDRLEPLGMEGTQKLSDLFINRKVPRQLRTWVPLLCDNGGSEDGERILWVVGQRRSRHARVVPETSQVVILEAETIL